MGCFFFERPAPFIIGFYHGRDKPTNVNSFLQPMLNEFERLCPDTHVDDMISPRSCTASLRCVIADSPMRSYLKGTKGHTGYWACDRCIQKGEMMNKVIIMTDVDAPLRTDVDFLTYHTNEFSIDEHVKDVENPSPFVRIGFNMISGFVIDSIDTMISEAFLKRLEGFASNPVEGKLSPNPLAQVEKRLKFFRFCCPYEFDRYLGQFSQCGKYKAHVLRQFLYYFLFPVFDGILGEDELEHIMLLQYAMISWGIQNLQTNQSF